MNVKLLAYRVGAALLCALVALPLLAGYGEAQDSNRDRVVIHVGAPSVWSLGQAHYLLAKMQQEDRALTTRMPDGNELDANGINATRIQIIKTLLDVEAQFSQKIGAENQAKQDAFKDKIRRRDQAKAELKQKQAELNDLDEELRKLKEKKARLEVELDQVKKDRERPRKDPEHAEVTLPIPPPGDHENTLGQDIAVLAQRIDAKQADRDDEADEVKTLTTQANGDVPEPNFAEVQLGSAKGLPSPSPFFTDRIKKIVDGMKEPRFAASIALDNFIGMQYEIIAKQLTLLRDEVGPDERIIFLELPSSIYTAACKGDEYIAQVQWEVTEYYDDSKFNVRPFVRDHSSVMSETEQNQWRRGNYLKIRDDAIKNERSNRTYFANGWSDANTSNVRAIDIIPRQSSLNVNDVQSTTSQKNFLGVMKLLSGIGVRVDYQKQRELYEQYLQQEVFASGFGKGRNAFGWTFGPLPGTKRIAPGVRTTYAVLVIPRTASLLKLKAQGVAFHRKETPALLKDEHDLVKFDPHSRHHVFGDEFTVIVPNERTAWFQIRSINYTPAKKGDPVTLVMRGESFSQQAGILVDGVPLKKTISWEIRRLQKRKKTPRVRVFMASMSLLALTRLSCDSRWQATTLVRRTSRS